MSAVIEGREMVVMPSSMVTIEQGQYQNHTFTFPYCKIIFGGGTRAHVVPRKCTTVGRHRSAAPSHEQFSRIYLTLCYLMLYSKPYF